MIKITLPMLLTAFTLQAQTTCFNRDFRFHFGEVPGAAAPAFDDSRWDAVGLPHSFSLPYFRSRHFPVGEGWYRKTFTMPEVKPRRRYRLYFEAAFQHCEVYLNGARIGGHEGGYTGFEVPLTGLKAGRNVLAVRLDNRWDAQLPPRAGEHVFSGGLYRDVWFIETGDVFLDKGRVQVSTTSADEKKADLFWSLTLKNDSPAPRNCRTELILGDRKYAFTHTIAPGKPRIQSGSATIENPKLWSPDSPHLHTVTARVTDSETGELLDEFTDEIGIRTFSFSKEKGFFLNGRPLVLRGANRHQDMAGWGDAVSNRAHERDAGLIKACGMNFVRGSHYPHDRAFLRACDRLGLLVWSENTFWGIGGFGKDGSWSASAYPPNPADWEAFERADARILREMIEERFNHPSVIVWGLSNEPFFTDASVMERARQHIRNQLMRTHEIDPTRPAGVGGAQRQGFDTLGGIIGYNGDGARVKNPPGPSIVTEYGSHVSNRPGVYGPAFGEASAEVPPWRAGQALWCAFHHGSIAGDMGRMGMIDYFRLPLRQWYWYRNEYAGIAPPEWIKPGRPAALRLTTDRDAIQCDGTDDAFLKVQVVDARGKAVDANPDVTLRIMDGPGEFPTGPSITFRHNTDIDIREGLAAIAFRAWHSGVARIRAESPGLKPSEITVTATGGLAWSPRAKNLWQQPRAYNPGAFAKPPSQEELRSNLAYTRPVRASSEQWGNPAASANDGNPSTRWCASEGSYPQTWVVDLERFYLVREVALAFEGASGFDLQIQLSNDGATWGAPVAWNGFSETKAAVTLPLNQQRGRFLCVTFLKGRHDLWAGLREVSVTGRSE